MNYTENVCLIIILDTSGTMSEREKKLTDPFIRGWIDLLKDAYRLFSVIAITHDVSALTVEEQFLFKWVGSGGTTSSCAYRLADELLQCREKDASEQILLMHITDGDNERMDGPKCLKFLEKWLSSCLWFGYIEINTYQRKSMLMQTFEDINDQHFLRCLIKTENEITSAIDFLRSQLPYTDER